MYAIIEDGSRQYRVSEGDKVTVAFHRAEGEEFQGKPVGTPVEFPRVLLFCHGSDVRVGQPVVQGMKVLGEVVDHPSEKTYIQKFRRRKNYRRLRGHRQFYTTVQIKQIVQPS
ncbi:MAG: 50S ribosomal protein L21 [Gemmataceae bacterium]